MNDLIFNALIAISELIYTFIIVFITNFLVKKKTISADISRKIVHLWAGGLVFFWFFYKAEFAKLFFIITPLIWVLMLIITAYTKDSTDPTVRSMTRSGDSKELLHGPLIFVLLMILMTFLAFKTLAGVAALSALGFGDGIAPIVGVYSKRKYLGGRKSYGGSLSVFLFTLVGILVLILLFPSITNYKFLPSIDILWIIIAAMIGTVVEAFTPSNYDNLTVPIMVWLFLLVTI